VGSVESAGLLATCMSQCVDERVRGVVVDWWSVGCERSESRLDHIHCDMFAGRGDGTTWMCRVIVCRLSCDRSRYGIMTLPYEITLGGCAL
jgi:hypothetical protein